MKIRRKIWKKWGDVSEQQIAFAKDVLIEELEMISTKFVIEIGEDGDCDYQNEISLNDVLERIIELKQEI